MTLDLRCDMWVNLRLLAVFPPTIKVDPLPVDNLLADGCESSVANPKDRTEGVLADTHSPVSIVKEVVHALEFTRSPSANTHRCPAVFAFSHHG